MNNNQTQLDAGKFTGFCTRAFEAAGTLVTNSYLCNQSRFTVADSWKLLKQRKPFLRNRIAHE